MKTFESYNNVVKDKLGVKLNRGDLVINIYKHGKYYLETGHIIEMDTKFEGDCIVELEINGPHVRLYETNLIKVERIVCLDTGEVHYTPFNSLLDLLSIGIAKFNPSGSFYFYENKNSKGINDYFIK